ncbi:hypothetical protein ACFWBI_31570 [Streptomyces sp. NPDC059982]|uniref:hypothetical protein n=2 Tax=unclassified Streptomyces TaxID=2593676 RepID=UPI0036BC6187
MSAPEPRPLPPAAEVAASGSLPSAAGTASGPPAHAGGAVRRLRPGTAATVLRAGLHLRGRRGSVTLEGSAALPALWRALEPRLRAGEAVETLLAGLEPGSAVRTAVETLTARLEAHDLLVTGPAAPAPDSGPAGRWLAASAADPAGAARALGAARAEVVARAVDAPLARAAGRALERGGLPVTFTAGPDLPEGRIHLHAHGAGPVLAVAAGWCGNTGYVTQVAAPDRVRADAPALEARLALAPDGPGAGAGPAGGPGSRLLLVGAAVQRLLCAVAGLPDPAQEGDDDRLVPGLPAVLLAQGRPARAEYRTWLGPGHHGAAPAPAGTLREALRRVAALGDDRCGALPDPGPGELAQLPVPLASCAVPGGTDLIGGAPRLDLARLEVFCRAAERGLVTPGGDRFTVGANPAHARGRALRATAARRAGAGAGWSPVPRSHWAGHPQARHWWTTLTVRLGAPARLSVVRAASGAEAYRAVVEGEGGRVLGEAVEATAGDAAAYAGLAAVASVAAAGAGPAAPVAPPSGGAAAALAVAGARTAAWEDAGWTGHWLAGVAAHEEAFQHALARLAGPSRPAPPEPEPGPAGEPGRLLRAFGFTVLRTPQAAP